MDISLKQQTLEFKNTQLRDGDMFPLKMSQGPNLQFGFVSAMYKRIKKLKMPLPGLGTAFFSKFIGSYQKSSCDLVNGSFVCAGFPKGESVLNAWVFIN